MTKTNRIPPGWALITAISVPSDASPAAKAVPEAFPPDFDAADSGVPGHLSPTRLAIGYLALVILSRRGVLARARKTATNQIQAIRLCAPCVRNRSRHPVGGR
jgi:hypothetical protein